MGGSDCLSLNSNTCPKPDPGTVLFTSSFFSLLLDSLLEVSDVSRFLPPNASPILDSYDFVVVGGGAAGCVVANRLSQNPDWKVLLLEAGGDPPLAYEVPGIQPLFSGSEFDWNYPVDSVPGTCQGTENRQCSYASGKMLGGSSAHNGMIYHRGRKRDYDNWRDMGNHGWSYDDVLQYFMKSEDETSDKVFSLPGASRYHRRGGEMTLKIPDYSEWNAFEKIIIGAKKLNYSHIIDFNRPGPNGFGFSHVNIRNGTRCSSAKAFLGPAKARKNLHVLRNAEVISVVIDEETKHATGVRYRHDRRVKNVKVSKEVIISAGAIGSPKILMLSGIGDRSHLTNLGVSPLIEDLKVGYNLMDHTATIGLVFCFDPSDLKFPNFDVTKSSFLYLKNKTGLLAESRILTLEGFLQTEYSFPGEDNPDIQVFCRAIPKNFDFKNLRTIGVNKDIVRALQDIADRYAIVLLSTCLLHPKSTGKVYLTSSNPVDKPRIRPPDLNHEDDINTLLQAIEIISEIGSQVPDVKAILELEIKECEEFPRGTRDYRRCSLPYLSLSQYHSSGTCRMGPSGDESAVVDPRLMVRGLKNLRVIDASVMPYIVSANTHGATVMIAEKGADMVIQDNLN